MIVCCIMKVTNSIIRPVNKRLLATLILALVYCYSTTAQEINNDLKQSISLQWIGLAFHPEAGTYPQHYHLKLDKKAYFVLEIGTVIQYNYFFTKRFSLSSSISLYLDCALVPAGSVHLGVSYALIKKGAHRFSVGLGPTLLFREDWHQFPEYSSDTFFEERIFRGYQYRFYPIGYLDYSYRFNPQWELLFSVVPGGIYVITSTIGLRYSW